MKLRVLVNGDGELVAATNGPIGLPEDLMKLTEKTKSEPVAGIIPGPGQAIREVEVPDNLIDVNSTDDFHRYIIETFNH